MPKTGINQSRSRLNNLIEVPSLYGQLKVSLAGKGRCYYDFLDGVEKTIPLIFELHEVNSLGSFAHYINVSKSGSCSNRCTNSRKAITLKEFAMFSIWQE